MGGCCCTIEASLGLGVQRFYPEKPSHPTELLKVNKLNHIN